MIPMGRILLPFSNFVLTANATTAMAPTAWCNGTSCADAVRTTGNFNSTLAAVVSAMIISFFVIGFASGFLRRWIWGYNDEVRHSELMRRRRLLSTRALGTQTLLKPSSGLDPKVVAALPLVLHKDLPVDDQAGKYADCPVCLAVFEASDRLKFLPVCKHAFHSECIDEWLRFHSTCPICRVSLSSPVEKATTAGDAPFSDDDDGNPSGIDLPPDFDVVGYPPQETPAVSTTPTAGDEEQDAEANSRRNTRRSASGRFPSLVPAFRVDAACAKGEVASIRRSSSAGTNLHALHAGDSDSTQHRNFRVHVIDVDSRSGSSASASRAATSLPYVWCRRRSFPNLRQIGLVWKSSHRGAGSGTS